MFCTGNLCMDGRVLRVWMSRYPGSSCVYLIPDSQRGSHPARTVKLKARGMNGTRSVIIGCSYVSI